MLRALIRFSAMFWGIALQAGGLGTSFKLNELYRDDLNYDQVSYLTTHNAFTVKTDGWIFHQQSLNFDNQFEYGVWSYMLDLHWCEDSQSGSLYVALAHELKGSDNRHNYTILANHIHLSGCWSSAAQREGGDHLSFEDFLKNHLKKWLDSDGQVVITLHLESYLGTDAARQLRQIFDRAQITNYIYQDSSQNSWPTLGDMRKMGTRLVLFSSNPGDNSLGDIFPTLRYRETEYNIKKFYRCERRFDYREASNVTSLLLLNHFFRTSFETKKLTYHQVNNPYADSMQYMYEDVLPDLFTRTRLCVLQEGIYPTFVAVDFVETGDAGGAREWVLYLNHLREMRRKDSSLPLDFFPTGFVSQSLAIPISVSGGTTSSTAYLLTILSDPRLPMALSTVFAVSSYQYSSSSHPAAFFGALAMVPWFEDFAGYHIPSRLSSTLNTVASFAFYKLFLQYHPVYVFVRFVTGDHARIMLGQRHRED